MLKILMERNINFLFADIILIVLIIFWHMYSELKGGATSNGTTQLVHSNNLYLQVVFIIVSVN